MSAIDRLADIPSDCFSILVQTAIKGMAILLVACITVGFMRKSSAARRHLTWLLVLVAVGILPLLSWGLPALTLQILPEQPDRVEPLELTAEPIVFEKQTPRPVETTREAPVKPRARGTEYALPAQTAISPPLTWRQWIVVAWAAEFILLALPMLVGLLSLIICQVRCRRINDPALVQLAQRLRRRLHMRTSVTVVRRTDRHNMSVPMVWGAIRPVLLLPANYRQWSPQQIESVLLHEFAHIKRRDWLTQQFCKLVCALHWFNPLAWLAIHRLRVERERACDDLVLQAGIEGPDYAQHLLNIARDLVRPHPMTSAALAMARASQVEKRLRDILDLGRNRGGLTGWVLAIGLTIVALIAVPLASLRATAKVIESRPTEAVSVPEVAQRPEREEADSGASAYTDDEMSQCIATLPNGVSVKLLGLFTRNDPNEFVWWYPDGRMMPDYESSAYQYRADTSDLRDTDDMQFEYGYLLMYTAPGELRTATDITVGYAVDYHRPQPRGGVGVAIVKSSEDQREKGLAEVGEIRAAAVCGPYDKSVVCDTDLNADRLTLDDGSTLILLPVRRDKHGDNALMVETVAHARDVDVEVYYESQDGTVRKSWAQLVGSGGLPSRFPMPYWAVHQSFRLPIQESNLKHIIINYRQYQGVAFKQVALRPGMQTAVKAEFIEPQAYQYNDRLGYPSPTPSAQQTLVKQPIAAMNVDPLMPAFTVDLDNGTRVELLGFTRYSGGAPNWWLPDGSSTALPFVTTEDMQKQGNIVAFRLHGAVDSFDAYLRAGAASTYKIEELWQAEAHGLWLAALQYPESRYFGTVDFCTFGRPGRTLFTIPVTSADIGRPRAVNQYDVWKIQSLERRASDGFEVELLHADQLPGDGFMAVDTSGKLHECLSEYAPSNLTRLSYGFPVEDLAGLTRQEYAFAHARFINVSLQGQVTKVTTERNRSSSTPSPQGDVELNPRFVATLPNGVEVGLVALGRLGGKTVQWWKPEGGPIAMPEVPECDVEGYDTVVAYTVLNGHGWVPYSVKDGQLQRLTNGTYVRTHRLRIVPLEGVADKTSADFAVRAQGGRWETRLEIPLSRKDVNRQVEINKLGYEEIREFTEVGSESCKICIRYDERKRALGELFAVDKAGEVYDSVGKTVWRNQCEATFPISIEQLSHLAIRQQKTAQATFLHLSLEPGHKTQVQIETQQVDYLIPSYQAKFPVEDIK